MNEQTLEILTSTCIEFREKTVDDIKQWIDNVFSLYKLPYEITKEGVVFKVEDTMLKDTKGNQEPITDIYFKVLWNGVLLIRRFSFTFAQYSQGYVHSHVSSGNCDCWTSQICFGGVIRTSNFTKTLVSFLCIYKVFCATESTNSSPYFRITRLKEIKGRPKSTPNIREEKDFPKYLEIVKKIRIRKDNGKLDFDIIHEEKRLQTLAIENRWLSYFDGKNYYEEINTGLPDNVGVKETPTNFSFKGEQITKRIYISDQNLIPKPQVCGIVIGFFQNKIKRKLVQELYETINSNTIKHQG